MRLPLEWLEYIGLYRLRGRSWIDFYAERLDRAQKAIGSTPLKDAYKSDGQVHLDFMKAHGLKPSHSLLDYGCGGCRSGIFFAKHLEPGGYPGVDISQERLDRGRILMLDEGIAPDAYRLIRGRDCRLQEIGGMRFDYVFANSVLTHMSAQDIRVMLVAMRPLLRRSGAFFFSYAEADISKRRNLKDFWCRREEMQDLCQAGVEDWPARNGAMGLAKVPN